MCELLGMSFNKPVDMSLSFALFRSRGRRNPHGWGMAWYDGQGLLRLVKEPLSAHQSQLSNSLLYNQSIESQTFVSHIRLASIGAPSYVNTHPFYRKLDGQEWVLAHNGTLPKLPYAGTGLFLPIGGTDSELLFCNLLEWIRVNPESGLFDSSFFWKLRTKLMDFNGFGTMNLLFSNGDYFYAYASMKSPKRLFFLKREPPYQDQAITMRDANITVELGSLKKDPTELGWIVATQPLTNEAWWQMKGGELIVFRSGRLVFRSRKEVFHDLSLPIDDPQHRKDILRALRQSPHRVSLGELQISLNRPAESISIYLRALIENGSIKQNSRDTLPWNNRDATFFTAPHRRKQIDEMLSH